MTLPTGFEPCHRFDFFEPGDKTALVCLDVPEMQRLVIEQLDALGYKVHTGLFVDDSILKLRAHPYDAVIFSEHFNGMPLTDHALLKETIKLPAAQRRRQTIVLIGVDFATNDEAQAFSQSVDLVVSLADLPNFKPVLRRAAARQAEFHAVLNDVLDHLSATELDLRT
jgi:hypothetical protein